MRGLAAALTVALAASHAAGGQQRVADTVTSAEGLFAEWYGPLPHPKSGEIVVTSRWLAPDSDRSLERSLISDLAQQYWLGREGWPVSTQWLAEGLALYSAVRGIHETLEGRHPVSFRYFGGFIPFALRATEWSPYPLGPRPRVHPLDDGHQPDGDGKAQRAALALHTLERYLGWPAFQQVLEALQTQPAADRDPVAHLNAIVSGQRGRDMTWFFNEAFRFDAVFDYGIEAFTSEPDAGEPPAYVTTVSLRRYGDGIFAGTSEPPSSPYASGRSLPVLIRFEDGTEVRDWWDGRQAAAELRYVSASRGVVASVDPDVFLVLDADRTNNTRTLQRHVDPIGVRMALRWILWLQDAMVTYSGLA